MRLYIKIQICIGIPKKCTNAEISITSEFFREKKDKKLKKKKINNRVVGKLN